MLLGLDNAFILFDVAVFGTWAFCLGSVLSYSRAVWQEAGHTRWHWVALVLAVPLLGAVAYLLHVRAKLVILGSVPELED